MEVFNVGDIVRLHTGTAKQRVTHVGNGVISTAYLRSDNYNYDRPAYQFCHIEEKETEMTTLYQVKGEKELYGTYLATNSQGQTVLEIRGSGEVRAVDNDQIEEVIPYTVEITFGSGKNGHYICKEGTFKDGDVVIDKRTFGQIRQINTKCKSGKELPKGLRRVTTEAVKV